MNWLDRWWAKAAAKRRIDHNAANLCMLLALMGPSLSIVLRGPTPSSKLVEMSTGLQITMCACIFGGLAIKLHGALSGTRFWFPRTPLRQCYRFGYSGAPMACAGLFVYGWFLLHDTPTWTSAMGAIATPMFGLGIGIQGFFYWLESRRVEHDAEVNEEIVALRKSVEDQ